MSVMRASPRRSRRPMLTTVDQLFMIPPPGNLKFRPEQALQIDVANWLRRWRLEGRLHATWTAIPNENPYASRMPEYAGQTGVKRKLMGVVPGAPDLVFVWTNGGGWIELKIGAGSSYIGKEGDRLTIKKRAAGKLQPEQVLFQEWCNREQANHAVCRSVGEVESTLTAWGALR